MSHIDEDVHKGNLLTKTFSLTKTELDFPEPSSLLGPDLGLCPLSS